MRIDKFIDSPIDPFAEIYYLIKDKINSNGISYTVHYSFDPFKGIILSPDSVKIKATTKIVRQLLGFYFDLQGKYRAHYYFPLHPIDKVKVSLNFNGTIISIESLVRRFVLSKKQREDIANALLSKGQIEVSIQVLKENNFARMIEEENHFLDNSDKYKQFLLAKIPEHLSVDLLKENNIWVLHRVALRKEILKPDEIANSLKNFQIIKECLLKPDLSLSFR